MLRCSLHSLSVAILQFQQTTQRVYQAPLKRQDLNPNLPSSRQFTAQMPAQLLFSFGLFRLIGGVFTRRKVRIEVSVGADGGLPSTYGSLLPRVSPQGTPSPLASRCCSPPCQDAIFWSMTHPTPQCPIRASRAYNRCTINACRVNK